MLVTSPEVFYMDPTYRRALRLPSGQGHWQRENIPGV
jgi:hypothetical protein